MDSCFPTKMLPAVDNLKKKMKSRETVDIIMFLKIGKHYTWLIQWIINEFYVRIIIGNDTSRTGNTCRPRCLLPFVEKQSLSQFLSVLTRRAILVMHRDAFIVDYLLDVFPWEMLRTYVFMSYWQTITKYYHYNVIPVFSFTVKCVKSSCSHRHNIITIVMSYTSVGRIDNLRK